MGKANEQLTGAVREALASLADREKAAAMQAYMKSPMPFLGVQTPQQTRLYRQVFAAYPLVSFDEWRDTVLALWRGARYREERYAAIALSGDRRYRAFQVLDALPLYEEMIVTGAWWDLVDTVAIHRVGDLLRGNPVPMRDAMLAWSRDTDKWKRRTAILCQVASKGATDEALLYACITPNLRDQDFFIRKAIGWALREYAKVNASSVSSYVGEHDTAMSPLSRREALRHIGSTQ